MGEDVCVDGQFLLPLPCTRGAKGRPLLGISGLTDTTALMQNKKSNYDNHSAHNDANMLFPYAKTFNSDNAECHFFIYRSRD